MLYKSLSLITAYLLGSIPFGYLLVKHVFTRGQDIRQVGSGNIGATNVGRVAGAKGAVLTCLLDTGKGALAVIMAGWVSHQDLGWMSVAAILAIVGHMFPLWLGFRGGKGVAAGVGVFLVLSPYSVLSSLALWIIIVYWKRYVSLGSIIAAAAVPLWILLWDGKVFPRPPDEMLCLFLTAVVACVLIIAKHHENIMRIIRGTENKIGASRTQTARSEA
ncbi:MAG: glycerol-3-phosphate 1-O-acyltransferase PlsY [Acidobacteria bacterium]|nr:glycerol-3-phosphate 1-O-acyltransferase PlsY [Acidobacteriota bacterium]